ncbi:MAG: FAD binding domain-containing protein [Streptosporangiaceae bacterium]
MKPARFAYVRPDTVDAAVACLRAGDGAARALAGGQSLLPLMNRRLARPSALVDLNRVRNLRYLAYDNGVLRIGALTRHADIEAADDPAIRSGFGVLPESARLIGHLPVRTRGTFGGSIAHADPGSEWCLLAVLLDAEVVVAGVAGTRVIAAANFFTGAHRTALNWDELVVEVRFPRPAPTAALAEFAVQHGHFPLAAAAAAVEVDRHGVIVAARIALSGVADRATRAPSAEAALLGGVLDASLLDHVRRVLAEELRPSGDLAADAEYRMDVAAALTGRALRASVAGHITARERAYHEVES